MYKWDAHVAATKLVWTAVILSWHTEFLLNFLQWPTFGQYSKNLQLLTPLWCWLKLLFQLLDHLTSIINGFSTDNGTFHCFSLSDDLKLPQQYACGVHDSNWLILHGYLACLLTILAALNKPFWGVSKSLWKDLGSFQKSVKLVDHLQTVGHLNNA